jgi:co-chaperonin GroES (HSP10)
MSEKVELTSVPVLPSGWRILVEPVAVPQESDGGILYSETTQELAKHLRHFGQVLAVGQGAYQDKRFEVSGTITPWCKVGDWVTYGRNAGQDIAVNVPGKLLQNGLKEPDAVLPLKILNDDDILAVITDPKAIVWNTL